MLEIEDRVNHLDELMAQLIQTVDRTSREMREFKQEMRDFKQEMRLSREHSEREAQESRKRSEREMQEYRERSEREVQEYRERSEREAQEYREHSEQEAQEYRERSEREMQEFKAEMRQSKRDLDKKWGELSNKLGTMAEDLVAPSIPRILKQVTGCTSVIKYSAVRVRKTEPRNQEFDVVAVCENYVFINETKSTLRSEYINDFYELMQKIHDYFPEFEGKQFIGAIASLYVDETLARYGEKLGLVVLGFGEELMDVLNGPGFVPKVF
ncbi:MAG: hypothetical protein BWK79_03955 [Beggiatoa sp. IS2]|nr:MAG: hypothetical protein BWK79_03955 [Beggiatoa sp. IS2]